MAPQPWQLQPGMRFIRTSKVLVNSSEAILTGRYVTPDHRAMWNYHVPATDIRYSIAENILLDRMAFGTWRLVYDPAIAVAEGL